MEVEKKAQGTTKKANVVRRRQAPVRLWVKAKFIGFRRSKVDQNTNQHLLRIQGVNDRQSLAYYQGKRVVYIYKAPTEVHGTKFRTIWGRIGSPHGCNGLCKARFSPHLPPKAMGAMVRVMLYPNRANIAKTFPSL